ncbi:MAG: DNA translocase FtsK [Chloroflexota bacterium]|nr:DNA translocase FtsK [Chloroflexota bacterium]
MSRKKRAKSKKTASSKRDWGEVVLNLWLRFERFALDVGGVLILAFSVMTLLALIAPELTGGVMLRPWIRFLRRLLGWGCLFMIVAGAAVGVFMLRRRVGDAPAIRWKRVFALEGAAFAGMTLLTLLGGNSLDRAEQGLDGGLVGWGLADLLSMAMNHFWATVVVFVALSIFLVAGLNVLGWLGNVRQLLLGIKSYDGVRASAHKGVSVAPAAGAKNSTRSKKRSPRVDPRFRKRFNVEPNHDERPKSPKPRSDDLPSLDLLSNKRAARPSERHINQRAGLIEQTLAEFGIPAKVTGFDVGPTVTQFAVEPGYIEKPGASSDEIAQQKKVRVSQISSLSRDLALALAAKQLRIQAPVPGRPYLGIEVPNANSSIVRLRPILESTAFHEAKSRLAITLGRNVSGEPMVADLATMPHLLIAGTTGSGKSVNIATITTCLVMNNSPEDLRLVMIDPKMVELIRFNGLPHLYGKVETDLERILGILSWVVIEMDSRYKLLEKTRSRNIDTYNRKMLRRKDGETLPRIVVLIDELADLMMSAPDQTEHNLVRLAQMARATGIHLVVATQRPSTDVVTGLIKANFPARMSFAVASSIDSRVILDVSGAEHLLGNGDMLFLPPEAGSPVRIQGVLVTDQELDKVVRFWQKSYSPEVEEAPPWEQLLEKEAMLADRDDLVEDAIKLVQQTQRASTSMLQRQLRVGYPRAARLMDELEELDVIGPSQGSGREREVYIDDDEDLMDVLDDQQS